MCREGSVGELRGEDPVGLLTRVPGGRPAGSVPISAATTAITATTTTRSDRLGVPRVADPISSPTPPPDSTTQRSETTARSALRRDVGSPRRAGSRPALARRAPTTLLAMPSETETLEPVTVPVEAPTEHPIDTDHGDHDRFAHYCRKADITRALVTGEAIVALCGKKWVPTRDPSRYPVCPTCKERKAAGWKL